MPWKCFSLRHSRPLSVCQVFWSSWVLVGDGDSQCPLLALTFPITPEAPLMFSLIFPMLLGWSRRSATQGKSVKTWKREQSVTPSMETFGCPCNSCQLSMDKAACKAASFGAPLTFPPAFQVPSYPHSLPDLSWLDPATFKTPTSGFLSDISGPWATHCLSPLLLDTPLLAASPQSTYPHFAHA